MFDDNFLSKCEIIGERQDDLPCYVCREYGDILILKLGESSYDVCPGCVRRLGIGMVGPENPPKSSISSLSWASDFKRF
jgi:hypothetical protein